jgi:3-oxoisoapionate kinase
LLYSYYGDDFTGSTDVLETLALAGIRTVVFLAPPMPAHRSAFADCQAVGIAGDSRSRNPEWMSAHLPGIFATLKEFAAPITHYKTCSTFDSSPTRGSIGRAMEIGDEVFKPEFVPVVVGAPRLGRFVAFGHLFAQEAGQVYRIDRHPTMSRHPVTPMGEADLRRHLSAQTSMRIGHIDLRALWAGGGAEALEQTLAAGDRAVLFDGIDQPSLAATGNLLLQRASRQPLFAVGSAGLTEALIHAWRNSGILGKPPEKPAPVAADPILVVSGSCSPVTEAQIRTALAQRFRGVQLEPGDPRAFAHAATQALEVLNNGESLVLYTALGPLTAGTSTHGEALGEQLGRLVSRILRESMVRRVVLCGGDTSSHAVQQLGLYALTFAAPLAPGAPLCNAHSDDPAFHGLQLVLKGGQMGGEDFFALARAGGTRV